MIVARFSNRSARSVLSTLLALIMFFLCGPATALIPAPPTVAARAHILIDANSADVIAENNADERLAPASLTKMMTGYILSEEVAAGHVSWDDLVTVSPNAWAQNPVFAGSSLMWIEVGTEVALRDLFYGLVISSGNDASVAIAEHLTGSEEAFAGMMNQYAARLGMVNTRFVNSHGLPDPGHYTTARDMALLARAVVSDHPDDYAVYSEREFRFNDIKQMNRNELLGEEGVDGLKTGYTQDAGYCLVSSAQRSGMRLVSVVMGTQSRQGRRNESRKLLGYGFRFFETRHLFTNAQVLHTARVWSGKQESVTLGIGSEVWLTLPRGSFEALKDHTTIDNVIRAPLASGQTLGNVLLRLDEEVVFDRPLMALQDVESAGVLRQLWDSLVLFVMRLLGML